MADKKWNTLGNVVGGSSGSEETSGKVMYEGKVRNLLRFSNVNIVTVLAKWKLLVVLVIIQI